MTEKKKILIVDDEPFSRNRLLSFSLKDCNYEIIGEAINGKDALEKIEMLKPDIIVTDIVMPVMDGLQLLAQVQKMPNPPKVVILTCYDDFDKAQSALRLGAQDYVTKIMLQESDFIKTMDRVAKSIDQERLLKRQNLRSIIGNIFHAGSEAYIAQSIKQLQYYGTFISSFRLGLFCYRKMRSLELPEKFLAAENWSEDECIKCIVPEIDVDKVCVMLYSDKSCDFDFEERSEKLLRSIYDRLVQQDEFSCLEFKLILGKTGRDVFKLPQYYQSLQFCKQHLFYSSGHSGILNEEKLSWEFHSFPVAEFQSCINRLHELTCDGQGEDAAEILSQWFTDVTQKYRPVPEEIIILLQVLTSSIPPACQVVLTDGSSQNLQQWIVDHIEKMENVYDLEMIINQIRESIIAYSDVIAPGMRDEIKKALEYINQNYNKKISIQSVADHVKLSVSWFGALFKREVNQSFSDYLTKVRIDKAKELLSQTDLRVNEISENVGISDPHYFSRIFTKLVGQNPAHFRKKKAYYRKKLSVLPEENHDLMSIR